MVKGTQTSTDHIEDEQLSDEYQNLTAKQQAIIDAYAAHPEETNRARCEKASEMLGESINESWCSQVVQNRYPEVAAYRAAVEQGTSYEAELERLHGGEVVIEPPTGAPGTLEITGEVEVSAADDGLLIHIDKTAARQLLESGVLPDDIEQAMLDEVLEYAFDD